MKKIKYMIFSLLCVAAVSCGPGNIDTELQSAEMAIAGGDIAAATSIAGHLCDDRSLTELSAKQLARLSIVYMQIADSVDVDGNVATAADLYNRAYEVDADSAENYFMSLPSDKIPYAMILSSIKNSRTAYYPDSLEVHADSVFESQFVD